MEYLFFWVFGVLLYSALVNAPEFREVTSIKSSFYQAGWDEYDGRDDWPNLLFIVGSLNCRGLFLLFDRDLISKINCGDSDNQVSVLLRKETLYDQGVRNKISFKDGVSHAQKYMNLKSKSFFSSTTILVQLVSIITNQQALELVLVAGSLSYCYNLTFGSIRKTMDCDNKRFGISMFLVSSKCQECNISSNYVRSANVYVISVGESFELLILDRFSSWKWEDVPFYSNL